MPRKALEALVAKHPHAISRFRRPHALAWPATEFSSNRARRSRRSGNIEMRMAQAGGAERNRIRMRRLRRNIVKGKGEGDRGSIDQMQKEKKGKTE